MFARTVAAAESKNRPCCTFDRLCSLLCFTPSFHGLPLLILACYLHLSDRSKIYVADLTALLAALKGQARHLRKTGASAASLCEGIDKRIEEVDSILVLNQNQNPNPNPYAPERLSLFELSGGAPRSGALRLLSPAMRFDWDFEISRGNFKIQKR
jgi:hypothetical protein